MKKNLILFFVSALFFVSCGAPEFDVVNGARVSGDVEAVVKALNKVGVKEDTRFRQKHLRDMGGPFLGIDECTYDVYNIPGEVWLDENKIKHDPGVESPVWRVRISKIYAQPEQVDKVVEYYTKKYRKYSGKWVDEDTLDAGHVRGGTFALGDDYEILVKTCISDDLTFFMVDHVFWNVPGADVASITLNK